MLFFLLRSFTLVLAYATPSEVQRPEVRLAVGGSESLSIPGLDRVSVAQGKTARVRVISPGVLLVVGLREGATTVRVWTQTNEEWVVPVRVFSLATADAAKVDLDSDVAKVSLEFLELDSAFSRASGIEWPDLLQFQIGTSEGSTSALNLTGGFSSTKGMIQHLAKQGWAKVLARPELFVRLGEQAKFQSGGEFPVPTTTESFGRSQRHIDWKPYGMMVRVLPQSLDGYRIRSDIQLEISEINQERTIQGIPSLIRRNLETKMNSADGETVILSGLSRQTSSERQREHPWFAKIPLLGSLLFSSEEAQSEETEVLMAITISFSGRGEARRRLPAFRRKFDAHSVAREDL